MSATERWTPPTTETDLRELANNGLLEESHYLDLKQELHPGERHNRELAKDIAAFAVDGGTIIIGVAEAKSLCRFTLAPVPLAGLDERVQSIARSLVDPPVAVTFRAIPCAEDPARGYLAILVPPSGRAPHMIRGMYYSRGDKGNYPLSDVEVTRLLRQRERRDLDIAAAMNEMIASDPLPLEPNSNARLFVMARPVYPRAEMALEYTNAPDRLRVWQLLQDTVQPLRSASRPPHRLDPEDYLPLADLSQMHFRRSPDGITALSADVRTDETGSVRPRALPVPDFGEWFLQFTLTEEGTFRVYDSRLSVPVRGSNGPTRPGEIRSITMVGGVLTTVKVAAAVSKACDYNAEWEVAVAGTNLADKRIPAEYGQEYGEATYRMGTSASSAELQQSPGQVAKRLTGRFLRALSEWGDFESTLLSDPQPDNQPQ